MTTTEVAEVRKHLEASNLLLQSQSAIPNIVELLPLIMELIKVAAAVIALFNASQKPPAPAPVPVP